MTFLARSQDNDLDTAPFDGDVVADVFDSAPRLCAGCLEEVDEDAMFAADNAYSYERDDD